MTPNLRFNLQIEPTTFLWNGEPYTISGSCELVPDNKVRYLHKRVIGSSADDRTRIPFKGRVVGSFRRNTQYFYLVENEETGRLEKMSRPQVVEEEGIMEG